MAVPSVIATPVTGNPVSTTTFGIPVAADINFLLAPPIFVGYQVTPQSIPNSAFTAITIDTEVVDSYDGHSTVTNPTRYTAQVAGWYSVIGQVAMAGNATGFRSPAINVNGAAVTPQAQQELAPNGSTTTIVQVAGIVFCNVSDYIEIKIDQTSGGSLSTVANASSMTVLWVHT